MADSAEKNVVNLDDYGQMRRGTGNGAAGQALRDVRDLSGKKLTHQLERMMDKVDDALFARAEKAESNAIQTLYFDAMRELRIIRKDIEEDFSSRFVTRFNQGIPRNAGATGGFSLNWEDDGADLGLVDKNDMEEDLAVANMVNKIRGTCTQSLYALDKRMGFLINDPDLDNWQNPIGPEAVCEAFREAARRIETGLEIRLVIFKLFDQHVACHLDMLYKEINQHLAKLGVLPEIKATVRRSQRVPGAGQRTPAHPPLPHDTNTDAGGGFGGVAPAAGEVAAGSTYAGYSQGYSAVSPSISALTFLQHGSLPDQNSESMFGGLDMADLSSGQVNVLHGIKQSPVIQDMGKSGDMTIDIVAMLFDYILDDKNIPGAMRALIGRLQIPVLKVAILDREFFSRKSHPARQLLNRLAATAVGWDEDQGGEDPLYRKVESIVQTILDEFEDNVPLFEQLLNDFDDFLRKSEAEARMRAERSAKVMEGQERLEVAKSTTMQEIEPRIADGQNLDFVREFVTTHWKNLLFVTCARNGKDSEAWNTAVSTMDDLIWSVKPKYTSEDRQRLVAIQPALLESLRKGMERLSVSPTERDDFIAKLIRAHGRTAINRDPEDSPEPQTEQDATPVVEENATPAETATRQPATPAGELHATTAMDTGDKFVARARALKTGDWIELLGNDGQSKRAKLSWVSPITSTYLFTDRQGLKVGNYTVDELARLLRAGRARVLNAAPLMDRAVTTVLKEYRKD